MHIDLSAPIWGIEEIAATFQLKVDSAREYTYRDDFPRPRAGFSRNLWTREGVLDWSAALPPKPRGRAGKGTVSTATAARPADTRPAAAPAGPRPGGRPAGAPKPYTPRQK